MAQEKQAENGSESSICCRRRRGSRLVVKTASKSVLPLLVLLLTWCTLEQVGVGAADSESKLSSNTKKTVSIPLASMTIPMHYEAGSHHVYVYVGSPNPQRQILILDTGSRYMAFPCEPCKDCGRHASPKYFNDTDSTTHRDNFHPNCVYAKAKKKNAPDDSCRFDQTYLEGSSWRAKEVEDLVWLATADQEESIEEYMPHLAIPFTFGCQFSVTGYFVHQVRSNRLSIINERFDSSFSHCRALL
jgi:Xylanase inhibitor N-terminal